MWSGEDKITTFKNLTTMDIFNENKLYTETKQNSVRGEASEDVSWIG